MKWIAVLLMLIPAAAWAGALSGVDDNGPEIPKDAQDRLDYAVMTYYEDHAVEKVNAVLDLMNNTEVLRKKTAWSPLIGFLTVVFADNKDHVFEWMSRNDYNTHVQDVFVAALVHANLFESASVFAQAHQWTDEEVARLHAVGNNADFKHLQIIVPGHIDALWGAFFGSGDHIYVDEIINVLFMKTLPPSPQYPGMSGDTMLKENKKLAETTLKRYAAWHAPVRETIESRLKREKDKTRRKTLEQLLPPPTPESAR